MFFHTPNHSNFFSTVPELEPYPQVPLTHPMSQHYFLESVLQHLILVSDFWLVQHLYKGVKKNLSPLSVSGQLTKKLYMTQSNKGSLG